VQTILPKIDRVIAGILSTKHDVPREIPAYKLVRDSFVRSKTSIVRYRRVREYRHLWNRTRVFVQYQPCFPTPFPFKVTLISDDRRNLTRREILEVLRQFGEYRLLLLEIALDCGPESGTDLEFVRQHALFGKCRPNASRSRATKAVFGSRKSTKFVRCYHKDELDVFRIELQLNSAWLLRFRLRTLEDVRELPNLLCPSHIRFVQTDWTRLRAYLLRRGSNADEIIQRAKAASLSIHGVLKFLRTIVKVQNAHRFLVTTAPTRQILRALITWAEQF
jgi:hypothetical protein